jgi:hypothetical protein
MIAGLLEIELTELEVQVSGELDVRGCLAADPDVRVGFESLDCHVHLQAADGTSPARLDRLLAAAERYCVNPPPADAVSWHQLLGIADQMTTNAQQQIAAARAKDVGAFVRTVHTANQLIARLNRAGNRFGFNSACHKVFG